MKLTAEDDFARTLLFVVARYAVMGIFTWAVGAVLAGDHDFLTIWIAVVSGELAWHRQRD